MRKFITQVAGNLGLAGLAFGAQMGGMSEASWVHAAAKLQPVEFAQASAAGSSAGNLATGGASSMAASNSAAKKASSAAKRTSDAQSAAISASGAAAASAIKSKAKAIKTAQSAAASSKSSAINSTTVANPAKSTTKSAAKPPVKTASKPAAKTTAANAAQIARLDAELAKAKAAFAKGDYHSAFTLAMGVCEIDCGSIELNLLIAKSALLAGDSDEALAAYDRVLIYDEQNPDAHFAMAQIYAAKGNAELLQAEISSLLANPRLSDEQRRLLKGLSAANQPGSSPFSVYLSASVGYETNPQRENDKTYKIYLDDEVYELSSEQSPGAASAQSNVFLAYNYEGAGHFGAELSASYFHKNYFAKRSEGYSDIDVIGAGISPKFNGALSFSLPLGYDYIILKGQSFLHSLHAGAELAGGIGEHIYASGGYSYARGIFAQSYDKDDNYNHHSFYAQLGAYYGAHSSQIMFNIDAERAAKSLNENSDYNAFGIGLAQRFGIFDAVSLSLSADYSRTNYLKYNQNFLSKRRDNDYIASAELAWQFAQRTSVALSASYAITNSNQPSNDSKNLSTQMSLKWSY